MMDIRFRAPREGDVTALSAIDAAGLATGHASFRSDPYDWQKFARTYLEDKGFALVAEVDGQLAGWAGVAMVSDRCVYRGVGEVSIYIAPAGKGQGVGRATLEALIRLSEERGYWSLIAQIFPENEASLALHRACGFRTVGTREKVGRMSFGPLKDTWRDTLMMERRSRIVGID
nr:GNAT family N-acetyltransferase [uncultured Cohaesibacter sp.]